MTTIALTGATGSVGGVAARVLSDRGIATRLVVRDADRAPRLPLTEVRVADYRRVSETVRALEGVDAAFMVSTGEGAHRAREHEDFVDAAVQAGVRHVVYLSFVGAATDATLVHARDHGTTERYLADTDLDVTVLRSNYYAETLAHLILPDGLRAPAGDGRVAAVARDDVAACVAAVMADPEAHVGQVYELTGPDSLDLHQVAKIFCAAHRRSYSYIEETDAEARASRLHYQAPPAELDGWLSAYRAIREGVHGHVTDDVHHLLGREPRSVESVLTD